jgi:hypothetical protein
MGNMRRKDIDLHLPAVWIPLKQLAIPDALYRHKKLQIVSVFQHTHIFEEVHCPVNIQNEEF